MYLSHWIAQAPDKPSAAGSVAQPVASREQVSRVRFNGAAVFGRLSLMLEFEAMRKSRHWGNRE
jgi:hypothetical protein